MKKQQLKKKNLIRKIITKFLTISGRTPEISKTREMETLSTREIEKDTLSKDKSNSPVGKPASDSLKCPYCFSTDFVKRGLRKKKHEQVQLYLCKTCNRTFTAHLTKGKHYPLAIIFDGISLYNLGYSLEQTCRILKNRSSEGLVTSPTALSNWLAEFDELCRFSRMREYALKKYSPKEMTVYSTLAHRQLFRYRFHRAKCELIIDEDFKHRRFGPLQEFLEMVPGECPHQYFQKGLRASEVPITFSKKEMIVRAKQNYATRLCETVLQSVKERKKRHDALQRFMLFNDSVTVATEIPVYLTKDDLEHMQTQLGFEMYQKNSKKKNGELKKAMEDLKLFPKAKLPKLITGHIDLIQIRNGQIHILDYKPKAEKERPIEQLTLYAMALSRLTGLRMFEFKCAWFDENDYFEFYPLHVLYKPKKRLYRKNVITNEGIYSINKLKEKIERIRPI